MIDLDVKVDFSASNAIFYLTGVRSTVNYNSNIIISPLEYAPETCGLLTLSSVADLELLTFG